VLNISNSHGLERGIWSDRRTRETGKRWTPSATSGGLKACLSNLFGFRPDSETTCGVMWPHTLPHRVTTHAPKSVPSNQSNLVSDNWLKKEKWACLYSVQPYTSLPCFSLSLFFTGSEIVLRAKEKTRPFSEQVTGPNKDMLWGGNSKPKPLKLWYILTDGTKCLFYMFFLDHWTKHHYFIQPADNSFTNRVLGFIVHCTKASVTVMQQSLNP